MCIGCALEIYIWLSNKVVCNIHIGDTLNYLNSRCNTAKLLWVVIYVVCYGRFSPHLVVMNICRQRLIKVKSPLWQRSLANENAVVCRQGAMRWRLPPPHKKKKKKKKSFGSLPAPRSGYATAIIVFFCSFTHLRILRSAPKFHQFFIVLPWTPP